MKGTDFGKAIGIDRPANVKDKIRKWQQELDADPESSSSSPAKTPIPTVPAPAAASTSPPPQTTQTVQTTAVKPPPKTTNAPSTPKSASPAPAPSTPAPSTPKQKPAAATTDNNKTHHNAAASPSQPRSAKKAPLPANKLDEDVHVVTAPKKRVVSDSHWRNKKSPPKNASSPKPIPTAWVRPAVRRAQNSDPKDNDNVAEPVEAKSPAVPKPKAIPSPTKRATGRTRSERKRRPSRPRSSGVDSADTRPLSRGSASGKDTKSADEGGATSPSSLSLRPEKEKDKTELVRMRRRRAQTSPRASLSTEDVSLVRPSSLQKSRTSLSEDSAANLITVEYDEPSVVDLQKKDESRRRRRRSRRHGSSDLSHENSRDPSPKEEKRSPITSSKRRSRTLVEKDQDAHLRSLEPVIAPATPPKSLGSRLEAWLQTTPDPITASSSNRRRKSKESVSTLELQAEKERSEISTPNDSKEKLADDTPERTSDSKRRRKRRSPPTSSVASPTLDLDNVPALATPTRSAHDTSSPTDNLSPTPTLKRRGAKRTQHSPTKDRSMSLPSRHGSEKDSDVSSSLLTSTVDSSASSEVDKGQLMSPFESPTMRRMFPSTGRQLSTIVSVETSARAHPVAPSEATISEAGETVVEDDAKTPKASQIGSKLETSTIVSRRSTRRRLASHADLISVLSMSKAGSKSIVSARSIRTNRSRLATATMGDIMKELASDESKYMRELRTLVDGVIPVLLSCVLSKTDSAVAIGLFSPSAGSDPSHVTKPIVDMGVSLERLKTLHKRIPKDDPDALLSWAQSAQRVYSDYIKSWRLGFQDVVVSLASADEDPFTQAKVVNGPEDGSPWDEGLPRNAEGYVVNGDGERVDVAYMLKRPLVRLKYLAKSLKGIQHIKPSDRAAQMSTAFQELVTFARKRSNDEHARLEDEAAAKIDPTRARDPRSLAPLAGVRIDPTRCVRARDHFDLHLYHSSGQELNCGVELLLRDNPAGGSSSGDLLICEVDKSGRWLLLPPIQQSRISARNGDHKGEIIVMIRGNHGDGSEWSEVMSLTIDDEQAGFDWVHMFGLNPIPPHITDLKRELTLKREAPHRPSSSSIVSSAATGSTPPRKSRTPSPHQVEIPIGEQANVSSSKRWSFEHSSRSVSPVTPPSTEPSQVGRPSSPPSPLDASQRFTDGKTVSPRSKGHSEDDLQRTPRSLNEAMQQSGSGSPIALKRTRARRMSRNAPSPTGSRPSRQIVLDDPIEEEYKPPRKQSQRLRKNRPQSVGSITSSSLTQSSKGYSVWLPNSSEAEYSDESSEGDLSTEDDYEPPSRPQAHRRASSVPTMEMPTIPRQRKSSQPTTPAKTQEPVDAPEPPASAPPRFAERRIGPIQEDGVAEDDDDDVPPPVPEHRSPSPATPVTLKGSKTPVLTSGLKGKRRSSSPLKHEYEPSTCSESSSESELEISEDESLTSDSSEDELEDDVPTPLMPLGQLRSLPKVSPPGSIYTLPTGNGSITPSQSASNTPYRAVPKNTKKASQAIASIMAWSDDAGQWKSLHPGECNIVVTPGKIQMFEMSTSTPKLLMTDGDEIIPPDGRAPLIAVELTPLVPLRKSTGLDIEIRSPPTSESRIKTGNYTMLRSRTATECDQLYAMINHSRINNPTYIALQNARGPYGQSSWAEAMDRQNAARTSGGGSSGWFGGTLGRRSSYRKTSTRAASISAATESSVGTMNTALRSALGRFSFAKHGRFNIRDSTLGSRSAANSFDTGSSGSGSGTSTPLNVASAGITNSKCRLYERETLKKWRDMGAARLTILLPDTTPNAGGIVSATRNGKGSPGARDPTQEKRILITSKSTNETLLDVTLSESCFERVARLGIAISVWEDLVDEEGVAGRAARTGGISSARARVFMVQLKSERECAWCFGLLGKMRY
ncbi:unnamed protein product [Periconia digitata]|uniref:Uncharacterized protein n=1 Tax=Periconia digitata TaxID=1303443 RepID=A0A9W4UHV5_9PLEO|nr:unnamed protein product [Periconia digitata]